MKIIIAVVFLFIFGILACDGGKGDFSLCGIGVSKPYYLTGLRYKGEIYQIEKEFKEKFSLYSTNNNGIVRVSFKVNCHGALGDIQSESYDFDYKKMKLNDTIEMSIKTIVLGLEDWIPGVDDNGDPVNSHSFLSFRIQDGEIIEILPK